MHLKRNPYLVPLRRANRLCTNHLLVKGYCDAIEACGQL